MITKTEWRRSKLRMFNLVLYYKLRKNSAKFSQFGFSSQTEKKKINFIKIVRS